MAIERMVVKIGQKPTDEQKRRINEVAKFPIVYDDDCPELTDEQYLMFAQQARAQRAEKKEQVISLRLSPDTIKRAKLLGKGYTGILSRLLDLAINNPEMVKKCL